MLHAVVSVAVAMVAIVAIVAIVALAAVRGVAFAVVIVSAVVALHSSQEQLHYAFPTSTLPAQTQPGLDDLFRKTRSLPAIYYLPLSDSQVAEKRTRRAQGDDTLIVAIPERPAPLKRSYPRYEEPMYRAPVHRAREFSNDYYQGHGGGFRNGQREFRRGGLGHGGARYGRASVKRRLGRW